MCGPHDYEGWSRKILNHVKISLCSVACFLPHTRFCLHTQFDSPSSHNLKKVHLCLISQILNSQIWANLFNPPSRLAYTIFSTLQLVSDQVLKQYGPLILRDPLLERILWLRGILLTDLHSLMAQGILTRRIEWKCLLEPKITKSEK